MTIEIVDFPIENGGSFHSFLYVYQRVYVSSMFQEGVRPCWFFYLCVTGQIEVASLDDLYLLLVDADMTLVAENQCLELCESR
jgi:hypothetical protein